MAALPNIRPAEYPPCRISATVRMSRRVRNDRIDDEPALEPTPARSIEERT